MKKSIINLIFDLKYSRIAKEEKIIKDLKLSPAEYRAILALVPGSDTPCNILAKKMGLSISRSSRVIHKLINNGYLNEAQNEIDLRITNVQLTQKGIKIQIKIMNLLEDCEQVILKNMSKIEAETFAASLTRISDILATR